MFRTFLFGFTLCLLGVGSAGAAQNVDKASESAIKQRLSGILGDASIETIQPTPVDNLYAVSVEGQVVYVTGDGRHMLRGELIDLVERRNLTQTRQRDDLATAVENLDEDNLLIYEPEGPTQYEVTVFTDIACPYCRRFHRQLDAYLERGIRIRYAFLPRAGPDSEAYDQAVAAWCAENPHRALTRAKDGETLTPGDCDNPVGEHLQLARGLGIRGTPAIITNSGRKLGGYLGPDDLVDALRRNEG